MFKKILILFIPIALLFSQENQQQIIEEVQEIDLLSPDKVEAETRYSMLYIQASTFGFWSRHWRYKGFFPTAGIGYRTHKKQHGFDFSINAFPFGLVIPFFKIFYLNYPFYKKNNFFYWGIGAIGIFPPYIFPFAALGYEFNPKQPVRWTHWAGQLFRPNLFASQFLSFSH